jgi:mRNA interferase HigB
MDVRRSFNSADQVGRVLIFNLRGSAYRLIATVHFASKTIYVKALLSHAEYDRKEWKQWV